MVDKGMHCKITRDNYHIIPYNADPDTYVPDGHPELKLSIHDYFFQRRMICILCFHELFGFDGLDAFGRGAGVEAVGFQYCFAAYHRSGCDNGVGIKVLCLRSHPLLRGDRQHVLQRENQSGEAEYLVKGH